MAPKRRKRLRYAWSLHFQEGDPEIQALSNRETWGWRFACELARDARQRSHEAIDEYSWSSAPLTHADIGRKYALSPVQVSRLIREARWSLFGAAKSDSGVYYRLQRKENGQPIAVDKTCAEQGCTRKLPEGPLVHGNRRYCREHRTGAARVRRHRAIQRARTAETRSSPR